MICNPFESQTPSVFLVGSPFQALCAVAAIRNLKIKDFKIIAIFMGGARDVQLRHFLDNSSFNYDSYQFSKKKLLVDIVAALIGKSGRYKRMFIGYFPANFVACIGMRYVQNGSTVVYLDDGNIVVSLLNNSFHLWDSIVSRHLFGFLAKLRGLQLMKNFYTIYSDVPNCRYCIGKNDLSVFTSDEDNNKVKHSVIFIGTNIKSYCYQLHIQEDLFIKQIKKTFDYILEKYPNEGIMYVPHGSDSSEYAIELCKKYNAIFQPVDTMIEDYILKLDWTPVAVFGFGSTALLNIKRMIPGIRIENLLVHSETETPYSKKYKDIADYYKKNDIHIVEWVL